MAIPVPEKRWQWNVNGLVLPGGSVHNTTADMFLAIKAALKGFAVQAWTVVGSCDGTTAGLDGVDRVVSRATIVNGSPGAPHSWVVLRQPATGMQLVIDFASGGGNTYNVTAAVSFSAGFTGGSTTARPTATDEHVFLSVANWFDAGSSATRRYRLHVLHSEDGLHTRVFAVWQGQLVSFWCFDRAADPVTGWTVPVVAYLNGVQSPSVGGHSHYVGTARFRSRTPGGATMPLFLSWLSARASTTGYNILDRHAAQPHGVTFTWPILSLGLYSTTVGAAGRHGRFQDLWFGSSAVPSGSRYDNEDGKRLGQIVQFVVPWPADKRVEVY